MAGASLLTGCTFASATGEPAIPTPTVELAPTASPELAPIGRGFQLITAATATPALQPSRYRIYDVTLSVDKASDRSGAFADGELALSEAVKIPACHTRLARLISIQGADQTNVVGRSAARGASLDMRAGERRRLNIDTVAKFSTRPLRRALTHATLQMR